MKNVLTGSVLIGYTSNLNIDSGVFKKIDIRPTKQYCSNVSIEIKDLTKFSTFISKILKRIEN